MKTSKLFKMGWILLVLICAGAPTSFAQSDRGTITGTVSDPSGAAVVGAKVSAVNTNTGASHETTTTSEGSYTLPELSATPYKISVEAPGFKTTTQAIQLPVQVTRRVDFSLTLGDASDQVTVSGDAPILQTETAVQQTNVTEKQVRELPLQVSAEFGGRTPLSFIFLDSSVTSANGAGFGAGSGAPGGRGTDASNFRVNGGQGLGTSILID